MKILKKKWNFKSEFKTDAFTAFKFSIPSLFNSIIGFISIVLVTYFIKPNTWGQFSFYLSIVVFFGTFSLLGIDHAFLRNSTLKKDDISSGLLISLFIATFLAFIFLFFFDYLLTFTIELNNFFLFFSLLANTVSYIIYRILFAYFRVNENFKNYLYLNISYSLINKIVYMLIFIFVEDFNYLVLFLSLLNLSFSIIFYLKFFSFKHTSLKALEIYRLFTYSLPLVATTLISLFTNILVSIFISKNSSIEFLGLYNVGLQVSGVYNILHIAIAGFWLPFVIKNHKINQRKIEFFSSLISIILAIGFIFLSIFSDVLFDFLGQEYIILKSNFNLYLLPHFLFSLSETFMIGINISRKTYILIFIYLFAGFINLFPLYFYEMTNLEFLLWLNVIASLFIFLMKIFYSYREFKFSNLNYPLLLIILLVIYTLFSPINYYFFNTFYFIIFIFSSYSLYNKYRDLIYDS